MKTVLICLALIASTFAFECTNLADGYYCDGTGFAVCASGYYYGTLGCAAGTSCQCGQGNLCQSPGPCTTTCLPPTQTQWQEFCQARINDPNFGQDAYYCADQGGFVQCVRDSNCPSQASIQSELISCPSGTECACGDTYRECSTALSETPCRWPNDYIPESTCTGHGWNCFGGGGITACTGTGGICNQIGDGAYCFTDADTNDGACASDYYCAGAPSCNHNADCSAGYICIINSCCGQAGVCAPACDQ